MPGEQVQGRSAQELSRAVWAHVAPFALWLGLMFAGGEPAAWKYAVRSALGLALFAGLRPWRWYGAPSLRHVPLALVAGVVVFAAWVLPESGWAARWPALRDAYLRWAVLPLGKIPEWPSPSPYAPAVCGWALALVRLAGSALVIAAIEEFFWRGFLCRWLEARDFLSVDAGRVRWLTVVLVSVAFGLEHDRWLAGIAAGLAYGFLYVRTRDVWAAILAHVVTNALLGAYVLATGSYGFW